VALPLPYRNPAPSEPRGAASEAGCAPSEDNELLRLLPGRRRFGRRCDRIRALLAEVESRTGIRGTLSARSDDPTTWMEIFTLP
jgi:hypothetical protein